MVQTSYDGFMDLATKGQPADGNDPRNDIVTYNNPADEITFGYGVAKVSADENGCELPDGGGFDFLGIAVKGMNKLDEKYEVKEAVPFAKKGRFWVVCEAAVTPDDPVYCVHTGNKGQFRADATNADQVTNARWMKGSYTNSNGDLIALLDLSVV